MSQNTYAKGWARILERADVPHIGTHGIRHRATTEIANSGVPIKVGMQLTAHKTVTMFMRYVHTEDEPVRAAAELVSACRRAVLVERAARASGDQVMPGGAGGGQTSASRTQVGAYRPYRHRSGPNRGTPPKTKRARKVVANAVE